MDTGVSLVDRSARRLRRTADGDALVEPARRIRGALEESGRILFRSKRLPKGVLRGCGVAMRRWASAAAGPPGRWPPAMAAAHAA
jgi:DNA-binding transcriptional LysR family regulator